MTVSLMASRAGNRGSGRRGAAARCSTVDASPSQYLPVIHALGGVAGSASAVVDVDPVQMRWRRKALFQSRNAPPSIDVLLCLTCRSSSPSRSS